MNIVEIRLTSVSEMESAPNFGALLDEYADECGSSGMPRPKANLEAYRGMEEKGMLKAFGAFLGDILVGFVLVLTCIMPHYSEAISITESIFVSRAKRYTGAGLKLLSKAEKFARDINSRGLLVSAPVGSDFSKVLELTDYKETNRAFFKGFA